MITGVNLPMLIKLAGLIEQSDLLAVAREMREHGRNAIWVASDLLRGASKSGRSAMTERVRSPSCNQLGLHARAAARFVHLATRFESQIRVGRDAKVMDGKSIMGILLLAAARGTTITISRRWRRRRARRGRRAGAAGRVGLR